MKHRPNCKFSSFVAYLILLPACIRRLRCVCMLWYRSFVDLDSLCGEGFALKSPQEDENQDVKKLISSKQ